jgi:hypothetical protein
MAAEIGAVHFDEVGELHICGLCRHRLAQLVQEHEGGLVLHIEIAGELDGGDSLRGVDEQADRAKQIDERQLARGEDGSRRDAELTVARSTFETAARPQIVSLNASAGWADRRAVRG